MSALALHLVAMHCKASRLGLELRQSDEGGYEIGYAGPRLVPFAFVRNFDELRAFLADYERALDKAAGLFVRLRGGLM